MKISIIVATYNRVETLKLCIESILKQSHQDFELLIVDDGSTDGTKDSVCQYNDQRIRYIPLRKNHGSATPARNRGLNEMTGDVFMIWDSDDVLCSTALETVCSGFYTHPDVTMVCVSTQFHKNGSCINHTRRKTGVLTPLDWFAGEKPIDAEILAVKKTERADICFKERGLDFMFYAEIMARPNASAYYINKTEGHIYLESDQLSLSQVRKKLNTTLSIRRAPVLDQFLRTHGHWYIAAGRNSKYAGFAYGAAFGFFLAGQYKKSRDWMKESIRHEMRVRRLVLLSVSRTPIVRSALKTTLLFWYGKSY